MHLLSPARLWAICTLVVLTSGCTFESHDGVMQNSFHPPLVYQHWQRQSFKDDNGDTICVVSSGDYNSLNVYVNPHKKDAESLSVEHNHRMEQGTQVTLNVGGHTYRTSSNEFRPQDADNIVNDLEKGGKAYLEWSQILIGVRNYNRGNSIIESDNFQALFNACHNGKH